MRIRIQWVGLIVLVLLLSAADAQAQRSCYECDPWAFCEETCYYCDGPESQDYSCQPGDAVYTTCGEYMGACMRSDCAPNWVEVSRRNVGTYGESVYGVMWGGMMPIATCGCNHHRVDRVTERDYNQCNINSAYWERQFCDDWIDDFHPQEEWSDDCPDCCDPMVCPPGRSCYYDYTFTCNHWHSCW